MLRNSRLTIRVHCHTENTADKFDVLTSNTHNILRREKIFFRSISPVFGSKLSSLSNTYLNYLNFLGFFKPKSMFWMGNYSNFLEISFLVLGWIVKKLVLLIQT